MLANIASIELPPVTESLTECLCCDIAWLVHAGWRGSATVSYVRRTGFPHYHDVAQRTSARNRFRLHHSACDIPFPSLIRQGVVREALTEKSSSIVEAEDDTAVVATGGIDLDAQFRPRFEKPLSHNLYCVSIPFLLHKLPFVQGITSAEQLGSVIAFAIINEIQSEKLGLHAVASP